MDRYRYIDMSHNEEKYILDNIDNKKNVNFEPILFEEFLTKLKKLGKSKRISETKLNKDISKEEVEFISVKKIKSNYKKFKVKSMEKAILRNLKLVSNTGLKIDDLFFLIYGDKLLSCNKDDLINLYKHYKIKINNLIFKKQVKVIRGYVAIEHAKLTSTVYRNSKSRKMKEIKEIRNKLYKKLKIIFY